MSKHKLITIWASIELTSAYFERVCLLHRDQDIYRQVLAELEENLPYDRISVKEIDRFAYGRDFYPLPPRSAFKPDIIVLPRSTEEISTVVKIANKYSVPIIPFGGGTNLSAGLWPVTGGILIDTRRMNNIEVYPEDMVVVAEGGATIENIRLECEKYGLLFADDPESKYVCTLGARISLDGQSTWGAKYGSPNKLVLGLEVVLPTGEILRTGSRVWKSSSGHKLLQLFVSAEGTLGIITKAIMKVFPLPKTYKSLLFGFKNLKVIIKSVHEFMREGIWPECVMVNDPTRSYFYSQKAGLSPDLWFLGIMLAGSERMVEFQTEILRKLVQSANGKELPPEISKSWWITKTANYPPRENPHTRMWRSHKIGVPDVGVPLSKIEEMWNRYHQLADKYGLEYFGLAIYQDGTVFAPQFSWIVNINDLDEGEYERWRKFEQEMFKASIELRGTITAGLGVGARGMEHFKKEHTTVSNDYKLMLQIKKLLDPNNIMQRGKVFPPDDLAKEVVE
ncbi:MAG: FAD-binding oxidoreductase [Candidatus Heimdallarchaeota archaeon]